MKDGRIEVFISYSWDNNDHQAWVLKLAKDLISKYGIIVILDQFELSAGKDLLYFMERSIEESDKVLIILTPNYKEKAERREAGTGYEGSMISEELFKSPITNVKFIPVLRDGTKETSSPKFLSSKVYHLMTDDKHYDSQLLQLVKTLYDKSLVEKPQLGPIPDFNDLNLDPLIDTLTSIIEREKLNKELDNIVLSREGFNIAFEDLDKLFKLLNDKVRLYKQSSGLPFIYESNNRDHCIVRCSGYSVNLYWGQPYSNSLINSFLKIKYAEGSFIMNSSFYFEDEKPIVIEEETLRFDLDQSKTAIWKQNDEKYTSLELTDKIFTFLIDKIREEKEKKFRK